MWGIILNFTFEIFFTLERSKIVLNVKHSSFYIICMINSLYRLQIWKLTQRNQGQSGNLFLGVGWLVGCVLWPIDSKVI